MTTLIGLGELICSFSSFQELCVKKLWSFPEYKEVCQSGMPHLTTFSFSCKLNDISVSGCGRSKKLAKRATAAAMLKRLSSVPPSGDFPKF